MARFADAAGLALRDAASTSLSGSSGRTAGGTFSFAFAASKLAGFAGAVLGWSPEAFWRATPAELAGVVAALVGDGGGAGAPPDAATMARLQEAFPDG